MDEAKLAVENVHRYYYTRLFDLSGVVVKNDADIYFSNQISMLRKSAKLRTIEDEPSPMVCPYCGDEMQPFIMDDEFSMNRRGGGGNRIGYKCWSCDSISPMIRLGLHVIDSEKLKKYIDQKIENLNEEKEDESDD